jgi:hypothetical protein
MVWQPAEGGTAVSVTEWSQGAEGTEAPAPADTEVVAPADPVAVAPADPGVVAPADTEAAAPEGPGSDGTDGPVAADGAVAEALEPSDGGLEGVHAEVSGGDANGEAPA